VPLCLQRVLRQHSDMSRWHRSTWFASQIFCHYCRPHIIMSKHCTEEAYRQLILRLSHEHSKSCYKNRTVFIFKLWRYKQTIKMQNKLRLLESVTKLSL